MARATRGFSTDHPSAEYLTHPGPHQVVAGTLEGIGMPGLVFAPRTGPRVPAVVFAHGLATPVTRYADTLRFLASWGLVAAAPATERGPVPSVSGLAIDLARVADRLTDTKLNAGRVTVDGARLATMGHGFGGAAAVAAAASARPPFAAVVTVFAAEVRPSVAPAAARVTAPALHLVADDDGPGSGADLAARWAGEARAFRLPRSHTLDATEGKGLGATLLGRKPRRAVTRTIRAMATAFLLARLCGQEQLVDESFARATELTGS